MMLLSNQKLPWILNYADLALFFFFHFPRSTKTFLCSKKEQVAFWTCMLSTGCIEFCSEIETHIFFNLVTSLYMVNMVDLDNHLQFIQPSLQTFFLVLY